MAIRFDNSRKFLLLAAFACTLMFSAAENARAQKKVEIVKVTLKLEKTVYANGCPVKIIFTGTITIKKAGDVYTGKVVMLIDETAQSQAEHTALFFETARPDITFIGTTTAGANGDITQTVLPGNIVVTFSGHNVRHHDGRQLQRVGIQPTIKVAPTIRGIVEGKDEILDAAISFLQTRRQ